MRCMKKKNINEAIELLRALVEDEGVGKALRDRAGSVVSLLSSGADLSVDKALMALEELNSLDLSSYHRTQLWDVVSLLESAK